jgi:hypothetical protein
MSGWSGGLGSNNIATNNWWGSPSGPYNAASNPNGRGDRISDGIPFSPWATAPMDMSNPSGTPMSNQAGWFLPGFEFTTICLIALVVISRIRTKRKTS